MLSVVNGFSEGWRAWALTRLSRQNSYVEGVIGRLRPERASPQAECIRRTWITTIIGQCTNHWTRMRRTVDWFDRPNQATLSSVRQSTDSIIIFRWQHEYSGPTGCSQTAATLVRRTSAPASVRPSSRYWPRVATAIICFGKNASTNYRPRPSPPTVEPVFGIIKAVMRFRQFVLRGLEAVSVQ